MNPSTRWVRWAATASLVLAAVAAYSGSLLGSWVYDDLPSIRDNPTIRHLWPIGGVLVPPAGTTVTGRPVLNLSLAINYAISGLEVWSYHALNLIIHILAGLTLFGIVHRTLQNAARSRCLVHGRLGEGGSTSGGEDGPTSASRTPLQHSILVAFCVALLWTLHPLQTESVAYVVQRAESLMGLFYLLTLYCFIRGVERVVPNALGGIAGQTSALGTTRSTPVGGEPYWFCLSFLACLFGMATKEVMVSAPVIVLLYDRTFAAGSFREAWRQRGRYYLGLAATWVLLGFLVASAGWNRGGTSGLAVGFSPWAYWLTQFEAVCRYLWLSVWPHPLVFEYGTFRVTMAAAVPYAVAVILLGVGVAYALLRGPAKPGRCAGQALGFAGAWFFTILAPTSLVPGALQMIAEHRMYLALAPIMVVAVFGLFALGARIALVACLAAALGFGLITAQRVGDYRTELALWTDTVAKRPDNARARNNLGEALRQAGRMTEAIDQGREAVRLQPAFPEAHFNLGASLLQTGQVEAAAVQLREALRLRPDFAEAHEVMAGVLLQQGDVHDALQDYAEALRLAPDSFASHYNFGNALFGLNRPAEAVEQYRRALTIQPDSIETHYNEANALLQIGRLDEAIAHFQTALRLRPDFADAHFNLAGAFERAGRTQEAIREYQNVLRLQPQSADARGRLSALSPSGVK